MKNKLYVLNVRISSRDGGTTLYQTDGHDKYIYKNKREAIHDGKRCFDKTYVKRYLYNICGFPVWDESSFVYAIGTYLKIQFTITTIGLCPKQLLTYDDLINKLKDFRKYSGLTLYNKLVDMSDYAIEYYDWQGKLIDGYIKFSCDDKCEYDLHLCENDFKCQKSKFNIGDVVTIRYDHHDDSLAGGVFIVASTPIDINDTNNDINMCNRGYLLKGVDRYDRYTYNYDRNDITDYDMMMYDGEIEKGSFLDLMRETILGKRNTPTSDELNIMELTNFMTRHSDTSKVIYYNDLNVFK